MLQIFQTVRFTQFSTVYNMKKLIYIIFLIGFYGFTQSPGSKTHAPETTDADSLLVLTSDSRINHVKYTTLLDKLEIDLSIGASTTNLSTSQTSTTVTINSDTGTDATIPLANGTNAGVSQNNYATAEKSKLSWVSVTQAVDLDTMESDISTNTAHVANTSNPHSVTKAQVGLSNVDNTSDANKPISTATQAALDAKDGSETKVTAGTNVTVSGLGTTASPYVINSTASGGSGNPAIYIVDEASDLTGDQSANANKIWELQGGDIDVSGAVLDLSSYNITWKDAGGRIVNHDTLKLGNFRVKDPETAVLFDQSGVVTGECLDKIVYVEWFSPNKNYDLIDDTVYPATINGALSDHVAIQNAMAVLPLDGATLVMPANAKMVHGDGTNPDYGYTTNPFTGESDGDFTDVVPDSGSNTIGELQAFIFNNFTNLTILGNGATIKAHPDQTNIINNRGFEFNYCENLVVRDLTYDGNLFQRNMYMTGVSGKNNQHGFSLKSCINPIFENVTAQYCVMDGFLLSTTSGADAGIGGTFTNCKALYNYRTGLANVGHSDITFYDCEFSFTGKVIGMHEADEIATGHQYTIYELGDTDWTSIGASGSPTVGETFISTGDGSGTGKAYGRYQTHSTSSGVDMEASNNTLVDKANRGQWNVTFIRCTFRDNFGGGLQDHWGSVNTTVQDCIFINDNIYQPQDTVEETTGNCTYVNNTFYNGTIDAYAGGNHIIGNKFYFTDYPDTQQGTGGYPPMVEETSFAVMNITDVGDYYAAGYHRRTRIERNFVKVFADDANFASSGVSLAKTIINVEGGIVENNHFINTLSTSATIANLGSSTRRLKSVKNNTWTIDASVLTKYSSTVGNIDVDETIMNFKYNNIDAAYGSYGSWGVELNGAIARFSGAPATIDGDEAYVIHVPREDSFLKLITNNSTSQGAGYKETWLDTQNPTYRGGVNELGATEAGWYFSDPQESTNPITGNDSYKVLARHETPRNSNKNITLLAEWIGNDGDTYDEEEFYIVREQYAQEPSSGSYWDGVETDFTVTGTPAAGYQLFLDNVLQVDTVDYNLTGSTFSFTSAPAPGSIVLYIPDDTTFRKVYTGGNRGNTASRPTTGGLGNYTEILEGATRYNTETSGWEYWNGSTWTAY